MKIEEFKKLIKHQTLAKVNDSDKEMFKAHLSCLLKGDKLTEICRLYHVVELPTLHQSPPFYEKRMKELINLFVSVKRRKKWKTTEEDEDHYDENGELIDYDERYKYGIEEEPIISKKVKTTTETTYYLSDSKKITPVKEKQKVKQ